MVPNPTYKRHILFTPINSKGSSKIQQNLVENKIPEFNRTPKHLGLIPDGNRRWAKLNNKSMLEAHEIGQNRIKPVLEQILVNTPIATITIWLLSTENMDRCATEVDAIFKAVKNLVRGLLPVAHREGCKLRRIGDISNIPKDLLKLMDDVENQTQNYPRCINFAINYGGQWDIITAMNHWLNVNPGKSKITKQDLNQYVELLKDNYPEPDLIIRTGADSICKRTSGFFPWHSIYSEYYFTDKMLPDLTFDDLLLALETFDIANRKFGK